MPFKPFQKKSAASDAADQAAADAPAFSKKPFGKKRGQRKTGKVAPAQKALMSGGRSMSGGGR